MKCQFLEIILDPNFQWKELTRVAVGHADLMVKKNVGFAEKSDAMQILYNDEYQPNLTCKNGSMILEQQSF